MKVEKSELAERFRQFSDEELVGRLQSGTLTEVATDVARAELRLRGLPDHASDLASERESDPQYDGDLVPIAGHLTPTEAHMLEARLHAEGIPATVADAHLGQANNLLSVATGGARVLVPEAHVTAAREVKAALARGDFALSDEDVPE